MMRQVIHKATVGMSPVRHVPLLLLLWAIPVPGHGASTESERALSGLVHQILVSKLPTVHEDKDNWGKTVRIFDGFKVSGKGLKIRVRKREKDAKHGLWKRYKVWVDDPARDLSIAIKETKQLAANRIQMTCVGSVSAHSFAELKQYSNGLQLLGVSAEADATVELILVCEVAFSTATDDWLPSLVVEPRVVSSKLWLKHFDLKRVGTVLRGKAAHELGDELRGEIQRLLRKHEHKVAEEANEAIAKGLQDGKLRLSPAKLLELSGK